MIPSYPPIPAPAWCAPYIGVPYQLGGRSMAGTDCWGLVTIVELAEFGHALPGFHDQQWSTSSCSAERARVGDFMTHVADSLFEPVASGSEQAGDIISMRIAGALLHVGVVVSLGLMLHSSDGSDSALERYDGILWRRRVMGFYRLRGDANARWIEQQGRS